MLAIIIEKMFGGFWGLKQKLNTGSFKVIYQLIYRVYLRECSSYVGMMTKIHNKPIFPHGVSGIFISESANIGKNCVIFHQVTIGSNTIPGSKGNGAPTIGNNCYIGAGAKIIGDITIGNNVRIGANCIVFEDIPSNSVVVLQQPKVIKKEQPMNNKFYRKYKGRWGSEIDGEVRIERDKEIIKMLG